MRLMDVLPDNEANRFNRPPVFNSDSRKKYFKVDQFIQEAINKHAKNIESKIGLLLQYGYFKASGRFFTSKSFKLNDIKYVSKILGVTTPTDFLEQYIDRTRQNHRLLILDICGHIEFTSAIGFFDEAVSDMVDKQMHPRKKCFMCLLSNYAKKRLNYQATTALQGSSQRNFMGLKKISFKQ